MEIRSENNDIEYYRNNIIDMIHKINKLEILEYLNTFIKLFIEKWG